MGWRHAAGLLVAAAGCSKSAPPPLPDLAQAVMPRCAGVAAACGPTHDGDCCEAPLVPGGAFLRDADASGMVFTVAGTSYNVNPHAGATVSDFRLDRYEITVGRFRKYVESGQGTQLAPPAPGAGAHPHLAGSGWDPAWNASLAPDSEALAARMQCDAIYQTWTPSPADREERPINCLTWYDAFAFCAWDGGFLPTEAEWIYAAMGGAEQRTYPWASPPSSDTIVGTEAEFNCHKGCGSVADIEDVGIRPTGNGKWGHADLAGNLWEWSMDWYTPFPIPCVDCAQLALGDERARVTHGGAWNGQAPELRPIVRSASDPAYRHLILVGARCARSP